MWTMIIVLNTQIIQSVLASADHILDYHYYQGSYAFQTGGFSNHYYSDTWHGVFLNHCEDTESDKTVCSRNG